MKERSRLDTPRLGRSFHLNLGDDMIGQGAERVARFLGTGRYLAIQTVIVVVWVIINISWIALRFDPYPFILLNLAFSTQAAYAAPLILLAQNRQELRDQLSLEEDRRIAAQSRADMDFLAREIAAIRMHLGELATRDFVRSELRSELRELAERLDGAEDRAR